MKLKENLIRCVIKEPGRAPEDNPFVENTLKGLQKIVGGDIEIHNICTDLVVICNETGMIDGLPFNCVVCGAEFYGTLIFAGAQGEELVSLTPDQVRFVLWWLGRMYEGDANG